jgi:hypothetical protein
MAPMLVDALSVGTLGWLTHTIVRSVRVWRRIGMGARRLSILEVLELTCIMTRKSMDTSDVCYVLWEAAVFFMESFDCSFLTSKDPEDAPWHLPLASGIVWIQSVNVWCPPGLDKISLYP